MPFKLSQLMTSCKNWKRMASSVTLRSTLLRKTPTGAAGLSMLFSTQVTGSAIALHFVPQSSNKPFNTGYSLIGGVLSVYQIRNEYLQFKNIEKK